MVKRLHRWLLGCGIILLLAGIGVLIRLDASRAAPTSAARLPIAQAVADLQDCFCHPSPADTPVLAHNPDLAAIWLSPEATQVAAQRADVEIRLVAAGQRILALPVNETVAADFMAIYTRASYHSPEMLLALDQLEYGLGILETQASTTRWNRAVAVSTVPDVSVGQAMPSVTRDSSAVAEWASLLPEIPCLLAGWLDDQPDRLLAPGVFGLHRRGPPSGAPYGVV